MSNIINDSAKKVFLWFNPEKSKYEAGSEEVFQTLLAKSNSKRGFSLILQLEKTMESLTPQLIHDLNTERC